MRIITLFFICWMLSITASAQFWKRKPKEVVVRYETISYSPVSANIVDGPHFVDPKVVFIVFHPEFGDMKMAEEIILRAAKHNMRFHVYNEASYDFSALAELYVTQHRYSEAKWYLLQSNAITREESDDKHTICNLLQLAAIKVAIGEKALAKADLQEAHDIAFAKCLTEEVAITDQLLHDLLLNKSSLKEELRYAEAVEAANKSQH